MKERKTSQTKRRAAFRQAPPRWRLENTEGLQVLRLAEFQEIPWLVHGFSTRPGGQSVLNGESSLNLSFMEGDSRELVQASRRKFQAAAGAKGFSLLCMQQIHSDFVHAFHTAPREARKGDASVTNRPGLLLAIQTADCVPILLVDPKKRAVGAAHAGWKGTLGRIAEKTVGRMRAEFASRPADLLGAIGPCIGPCCYEVGADFVSKFAAQFADAADYFDEPRSGEEPNPLQWLNMAPPGHQPPPKSVHLDLRKANRSQLLAVGLKPQNIFVSEFCTACRTDLFFSYRKEGAVSGRLMSVIGIR